MKRRRKSGNAERGAALITVMTMIVIISALAVVVVDASSMSIRRTANQSGIEQSRWYLLGAESYATARIADLQRREAENQHIDQAEWQGRVFAFPLDDGVMNVELQDGGNCFNLNSLVDEHEGGVIVANGQRVVQFARLLDLLQVPSDRGGLANALADWLDADTMPLPRGAEDAAYVGVSYRVPNTLLADVSELRRVQGFNSEIVNRLTGFACVRPTSTPNLINPNTLRVEQAPVLASAITELTLDGARAIIRDRPSGGWRSLDDFFAHSRLTQIGTTEAMRAQFTLRSSYFVLNARVERPSGRESSVALIRADGGRATVVRRLFISGAARPPL